uniref:Putative colanic acid biosynthesis acetyltransferase n=1 Tax=Ignavibacterium album TaxID=591197 RepID=A0A7V3E740_9BACT
MKSHNIENINKFPYPFKEYILRALWVIVQATIWKLLWHRFYFLRVILLKLFGSKIKIKCMFFGSSKIHRPWDLEIDQYVTIGPRVNIYNLSHVKIGKNTIISQDVYICGGTHDYTNSRLPLVRKEIIIGNDVWIGAGAFIGPGVKIGNGVVIGARTVLVKDADPWSIYVGNPAKKIKERTIYN